MYTHITRINEYLKGLLGDLYSPLGKVTKVIAIIVISILAVKVGTFLIRKFFEKQKSFKYGIDSKKVDTMSTLLASIYRYTVYLIAAVIILSDVFELKSILAAAGIGGVAIGLGAQSLIKDVISGFFIIMEDQFVVGDMITIESMMGTVEQMELRVTKLRSFNGDLYIVPNGEIKKVTNHTRGNKAVIVDVPIAYSTNLEKALEIANRVCQTAAGEYETITEEPKVLGITEFGKDSFTLRITAKTIPNEQWEVERKIRRLIKDGFAEAGLEFRDRDLAVIKTKEAM